MTLSNLAPMVGRNLAPCLCVCRSLNPHKMLASVGSTDRIRIMASRVFRSQVAFVAFSSPLGRPRMSGSAASTERDAKRRRLKEVVGLKGISSEALVAVLRKVKEKKIEPASRWEVHSLLEKEWARVEHTIALPIAGGGSFEWKIARVDLALKYFAQECVNFKVALADAVTQAQGEPLRAIVYLDEVVPGNVLNPVNKRKFWAFYLSFVEFGRVPLMQEQHWLPIAFLRSNVAAIVDGGVSSCTRRLLRSMLFEPSQLAGASAAIKLDSPVLIRVQIKAVLGDESALKAVWGCNARELRGRGLAPCVATLLPFSLAWPKRTRPWWTCLVRTCPASSNAQTRMFGQPLTTCRKRVVA